MERVFAESHENFEYFVSLVFSWLSWCIRPSRLERACHQLLLRERDSQQQRVLRSLPRLGHVERFGQRVCFSSSTSAADRDRRDAEADRQVRVGRSFTEGRVEPERRCRLQPRAYDRRTFRRRSRGAIADQLLRDRDRARLAPPLILFGDGGVNGLLEI